MGLGSWRLGFRVEGNRFAAQTDCKAWACKGTDNKVAPSMRRIQHIGFGRSGFGICGMVRIARNPAE